MIRVAIPNLGLEDCNGVGYFRFTRVRIFQIS